ncbi:MULTISPECIES: hypothetical protein [unclassified Shinella]|uniref:hypothetical protein n=1 Tax=unclassified Shinella TaxID=2643062 RepID=UPI00225D0E1A|nr:hypothetical protein [Shinella sp. YE25]MDC7259532.1 hypothetical protein [Shinella sp. YE25]CAI0341308.1 conserved membrane hypothetical protein [Rhizobiaceae bacterium]
MNGRPDKRNPLSRLLRHVARAVAALATGIVRGILLSVWHFVYFLLCLFRPVVNVLMLGGVIMPLVAFVAFVKPEAANGMPFWVFLLMAAGFVGISMGYSKFVDLIAPSGTEDPADRYRRPDWR